MPNRYLRASYLESEAVSKLSSAAEVLWTRLIVTVDDWGRIESSPRLLRAKLFPLRLDSVREADVQRLISECEKAGLVRLYSTGGKEYLQMMKWEKGRAGRSKCPDPPPEIAGVCMLPQTSVRKCLQPPADVPDPDSGTDPDPDPDTVTPPEAKTTKYWPDALRSSAEFQRLFTEWEDHKRGTGYPITSSARPHVLTQLANAGVEVAIVVLKRSLQESASRLLWDPPKNGAPPRPRAPQPKLTAAEQALQKLEGR